MPLTLAQAKVGMADKIDQTIIDTFQRESFILDKLTFDNTASPGTGGSTLTYGYTQLLTPTVAAGRAINSEYQAGEALRTTKFAVLKIFGGAFTIDRVLEETAAKSEVAFQFDEKSKATVNKFHYDFINGEGKGDGDVSKPGDGNAFDGLNVLLTGASTEYIPSAVIDLSDQTKITTANAKKFDFQLRKWLKTLSRKPDQLLMNSDMLVVMGAVATELGYYTRSKDDFGRDVEMYSGIPMVDMGSYWNGSELVPCIPNDETNGTSIYAVSYGLNALHAASPEGEKIVHVYKPDFKTPGAVKKGEVEMVAAIVLKNTTTCGAFRKVKVA